MSATTLHSRTPYRDTVELVIVGALIFVASFAWRDFFTDVENKIVPKSQGLFGRFLFTVVETLVIIWLILAIQRSLHPFAANNNNNNAPIQRQGDRSDARLLYCERDHCMLIESPQRRPGNESSTRTQFPTRSLILPTETAFLFDATQGEAPPSDPQINGDTDAGGAEVHNDAISGNS